MKHGLRLVLTIVVAAGLFAALSFTPVLGETVNGNGTHGKETAVELSKDFVTIETKSHSHLVTNTGDRWPIAKNPLIIGTDGKQVLLRDMPVPCDVEILYYQQHERPMVYRVDIKRVSQDATPHFMETRTQ